MYQRAKFGFILAAAALFCWANPVLADGPTVPYKDHASGEVDTLSGTYPSFTQTYSATGEATHLGHSQYEGSQILQFADGTKPLEVGAHGEVLDGFMMITAADGSILLGQYSGTFERPSPDFVVLTIDLQLVGVTGRVTGVTVTATTTIIASGPFVGNPFTWTTDGEWTFPD
jgi:hypothetical protein